MKKGLRTTFAETIVAHLLPGALYSALLLSWIQDMSFLDELKKLVVYPAEKPWLLVTLGLAVLAVGIAADALRFLLERYVFAGVTGTGFIRGEILAAARRAGESETGSFAVGQLLATYHYAEFCGNSGIAVLLAGLTSAGAPPPHRILLAVTGVLLAVAWLSAMNSVVEGSRKAK